MKECELCGSTENLDEHHTSYEPERTMWLCRSCHQKVHKADEHPLKPNDSREKTTIEVSEEIKQELDKAKKHPNEPYKDVVDRLIETYDGENNPVTKERVREIINKQIAERVLPEAQR